MPTPTVSRDDLATCEQPTIVRDLIVLGALSACLYAAVALLSRQFTLDVPSADRPHLLTFGLFGLLFALYLFALRQAVQIIDARRVVGVIVGFAVAFRLLLLGTTPVQEIDLYRYIWDGQVVARGISPYAYSPQQVIDAAARQTIEGETAPADLRELVDLPQQSPALNDVLRTIHFADLTTPYPPVSQAAFALAAVTTPEAASTHVHLVVLKAWIVLFDLLTIVAMIGLLRATGRPVGWCLAYAWCPLVLKEFANSGHLDAIAVCLTTAALWRLIVAVQGLPSRLFAAAVLLGLAIGAKLYPIVLLPLTAGFVLTRRGWRSAVLYCTSVATVAGICLSPMLTLERDVPSGLSAFLTRWQMNDLLFRIVNENLDPSRPVSKQPWFAVVRDDVRLTIVSPVMRWCGVDAGAAAFLLTRGLTLTVFAVIAGWLVLKVSRFNEKTQQVENEGSRQLLEAAFLTLAWFWLLAPTQNPWYWTWCLPLLPFARSRAWLWVSGLTMVYYLRFWFNAHWPGPPAAATDGSWTGGLSGASFFDLVVVWFEFGPLLCGLLVNWLIRRRQQ